MNSLKDFYIFIAMGLMNILPVNSCPDMTRPHEYQCNTYYKCLEVTANEHIWMTMRCNEGLTYVHKLRKCILLDDNWDCQLQNNIILMNSLSESNSMVNEEQAKQATNSSLIQNLNFNWNDNTDLYFEHGDGSGNGSDENYFSEQGNLDSNNDTVGLQKPSIALEKSSKTENIDLGLTAHLQRLSQLVNGLSKTYQGAKGAASELRPDQLNAFLTLFNIRNQFYSIATHENKEPLEQRQKFMHPLVYHQEQEEMRIPIISNMHNEISHNPNNNIASNYLPHPLGLGLLDDFNDKDEDLLEDDINYVPPIPNRTWQTILELSNQLLDSNGLTNIIPYPSQHPINPLKDNNQMMYSIDTDFKNKYPNTFNMQTVDQNVGIYKPSKMERRNPSQTTTIIHNNLIPFHIFSSDTNGRPLVDSYGQQLDTYPPLKTNLDHLSDFSNISPKNTINSSNNYNRFSPFDEHPVPDIISTFYTPSLHLNDQNVNTIFQMKTYPPKKLLKWHNYYSNSAYNPHSSNTDTDQVTTDSLHLTQTLSKPYSKTNRVGMKGSSRWKPNIVQNHQITNPHGGSQIVNIEGNFVSLNTLLNSIRHLFTDKNTTLPPNVQVINCASGIRQANITDCTRYYVCSKTTNKILSYSCPPYTAFNTESRICDSNTYIMCTNYQSPMLGTYTISDNKRLQMLGLQALQDLKYMKNFLAPSSKDSRNTYEDMTNSLANGKKSNKTRSTLKRNTTSTTISPISTEQKYDCQEGDKIPDPTSPSNYFVCFKTPQDKEMKYLRLACTKGLIFCSQTNICTLPIRCL